MHPDEPPVSPCLAICRKAAIPEQVGLPAARFGFNYQVGQWVWGIEAEFSATRNRGRQLDVTFPDPRAAFISRPDFIGTVAARLGLA